MGKNKYGDGDIYEGPVGLLKDSSWLTAEALPPDKDVVVQIESVRVRRNVEFKAETKAVYGSLVFAGKDRELGLNATNLAVLTALYGSVAKGWFGKWIALYVDHDVRAFGRTVSAVRIRPKRIDPPKKGADGPVQREPGDDTPPS
jgi:hypothetical protein